MANPLVGAAGISAGGSIVGGLMGAKAAKSAARTQAASADYAARLQQEQFDKQVELQAPFREAGLTAQNKLLDYMGLSPNAGGKYARDFSMADYQADPGYAFRLGEGMKGLNATAAARGGLISGNALRAATQYGQEMGSQEYQNAYNRYQINRSNQLTPLQSLMGAGQTATNTMGQAGQNYANQAGEAAKSIMCIGVYFLATTPPKGAPAPIFLRCSCAFSAASRLSNGPLRTRVRGPCGVSTFSVKDG